MGISVREGVVGLYVGSDVGLRVLGFLVDGFLVVTLGLRVGFFFGGVIVVVELVVAQCAGVSPHQPNYYSIV